MTVAPAPPGARERRKRHDGTEIDSTKNLAEFVQSFAASSDEETAPPAPESAPPPAAVQIAYDPYGGKTPDEIIAEAKEETRRARAELDSARSNQALAQETARSVLAEQQRAAQPKPEPRVDPREAKIDDLTFSDPAEARRLQREIDKEERSAELASERKRIKAEIEGDMALKQQRAQGDYAYTESMRRLRAAGVPEADLQNRFKITGLYTTITLAPRPDAPNPYYTDGGPLNPDVIERAWRDLYGVPQGAQPAPVAPPPPQPQFYAPPGSQRPAPAATAPRNDRAPSVSADDRRDITHLAQRLGADPEDLINRRARRLANKE